ncbi:hypothetical protein Ahu01nite_060590 [Winogradskya humida]|uniref:Uncharacterized protein n=2 Tax=Winogradskya humida TaxID=113566 RepID=A0ABQ3ZXQ3_9ACTN|nr:hypothetical protein Ahu01nite_060590 [Actinoplanes humidus]
MLLVRHLTEHHAASPGSISGDFPVHFHAGEEAVAAGLLAALGPSDAIVSTVGEPAFANSFQWAIARARDDVQSRRRGVTVCLVEAGGQPLAPWLDAARRAQLPILFCSIAGTPPEPAGQEPCPDETADCSDVEAVLTAARTSLRNVRDSGGARLLDLAGTYGPSRLDPIEVLALRMVTDHQLDDNALCAIDTNAAARAEATLAASVPEALASPPGGCQE